MLFRQLPSGARAVAFSTAPPPLGQGSGERNLQNSHREAIEELNSQLQTRSLSLSPCPLGQSEQEQPSLETERIESVFPVLPVRKSSKRSAANRAKLAFLPTLLSKNLILELKYSNKKDFISLLTVYFPLMNAKFPALPYSSFLQNPFFRLWISYQMEIEEVKTRQPLQKSQWDFLSQAQTATNSKECLRRKSGSGFY